MTGFQVFGLVIALVAVFGYLNHRFVHLPDAIGITAIGVVVSVLAVLAARIDPAIGAAVAREIGGLDFSGLLLHGVLGLLLFAGSMHLNIDDIAREKWLILVLATLGVAISTVAGRLMITGFSAVGSKTSSTELQTRTANSSSVPV